MKLTNTIAMRPSMPAVAGRTAWLGCTTPTAQLVAVGQPAVEIVVRTSPIYGTDGASALTSKINFVGVSESLLAAGGASVTGDHQVQLSTMKTKKAQGVKATDARGIPPRGRPV